MRFVTVIAMASFAIYPVLSQDNLEKTMLQLPYQGVEIADGKQHISVGRAFPAECMDVHITPKDIFSGDYAGKHVPATCAKAYVTTVGTIQPMHIDSKIETFGELETLYHLQLSTERPEQYAVVDARRSEWFEMLTIPGAINVPYTELDYDALFHDDYVSALAKLGISYKNGKADVAQAKTIVVFCNGNWCVQSKKFIQKLIALGYPESKLKWYRGGLQDWTLAGFTAVPPASR